MHRDPLGEARPLEPRLGGVGVGVGQLEGVEVAVAGQLARHPHAAVAEEGADLEDAGGAGGANRQAQEAAGLRAHLDRRAPPLEVLSQRAQEVVLLPVPRAEIAVRRLVASTMVGTSSSVA